MQLVLINNRIVAHGENFLAMGGVVINTETGAKFDNATIAECENCPSDIEKVGYEYHAGVFVPCAPFGPSNGNGTVPVLCSETCKSIRDSLVPFGRMAQIVETTYNGSGTGTIELTFPAIPRMAFILGRENGHLSDSEFGIAVEGRLIGWQYEELTTATSDVTIQGRTLTIKSNYDFNYHDHTYKVIAILQGGE